MRNLSAFVLTLLLISNLLSADNQTVYVSPGISISWNLEGNFSFSPKISIGYYENQNFTNLTVGYCPMSNDGISPFWI